MVLKITPTIRLDEREIEMDAVRSQGAGGQNVNKVATAVQLRFDITGSSLPEPVKARLRTLADHHISDRGMIVIKAQSHRSQEQNKKEALARLAEIITRAAMRPKSRKATRPTLASRQRRLQAKARRGAQKTMRKKVDKE